MSKWLCRQKSCADRKAVPAEKLCRHEALESERISMKKNVVKSRFINRRYLAPVLTVLLTVLVTVIVVRVAGCKQPVQVSSLLYEAVSDSTDTIMITGLTDKGKTDERIVIPAEIDGKRVVSIDAGAFRDCQVLQYVEISEGITEIKENAFFNCTGLKEIIIPKSVSSVGTNAMTNTAWEAEQFAGSDYVTVNGILISVKPDKTKYILPDGVRVINAGVFYNNRTVESVAVPESTGVIGAYAFAGCTSLNSVNIPSSVVEIGYCAFENCGQLSIIVPDTVTRIGDDAFLGVKSVTSE